MCHDHLFPPLSYFLSNNSPLTLYQTGFLTPLPIFFFNISVLSSVLCPNWKLNRVLGCGSIRWWKAFDHCLPLQVVHSSNSTRYIQISSCPLLCSCFFMSLSSFFLSLRCTLTHGLLEDATSKRAGPQTHNNYDLVCVRWAANRGRIALQNPWRVAVCFCNISQEVKSDPIRRRVRKQSLRFCGFPFG